MLAWEPSRSFQGCSNHDTLKRSVRDVRDCRWRTTRESWFPL